MTEQTFALICYNVLMACNDGYKDKSPDYMAEKVAMLSEGYNAFAYLDIHNMRKVIGYLVTWKQPIPDVIQKEMDLQNEAATELAAEGFEL